METNMEDNTEITMLCSKHRTTYLSHEGCKQCDYRCIKCDLKFMTLNDLGFHVSDNHKGYILFDADIVIKTKLGDCFRPRITGI